MHSFSVSLLKHVQCVQPLSVLTVAEWYALKSRGETCTRPRPDSAECYIIWRINFRRREFYPFISNHIHVVGFLPLKVNVENNVCVCVYVCVCVCV